jgi:hypothetical protein
MRYYLKAVRAYFEVVFRPDEDDLRDPYTEGVIDPLKKNVIRRYIYYSMEELMIVNPATGCYEHYPMPMPINILGRFYWWVVYIWQTKIAKTHI